MSALHSSFLPSKVISRQATRSRRCRAGRTDSLGSTIPTSGSAVAVPPLTKDWNPVQRAIAGDFLASEELFATRATRLYRIAFSVLHNKEDAEDAVQNSLCNALINLRSFKGRSSFSTWLTRIVINSALMILRKNRNARELSIDAQDEIGNGLAGVPG